MEGLNYCLLCGETSPNDNSNETNTTLFVTSQEFRTVFQCFLKLFEVSDPPWFEKAFVFCSECTRMLTVVSELENELKEVEKRLKESEQVVKDRLKGSEVKFEMSGAYQKDQRYWKVRGPFLSKEKTSTEAVLPPAPSSLPATPQEIALEMEMEVINVEMNPTTAEMYFNEADDDDDDLEEQQTVESPAPASQQKRLTRSSTRSRNPPMWFNPDEDEPKRKQTFPGHEKTISDELEEEHDVKPETSSSPQSCDPISFAQQLEGGVVEYITFEVEPPSLDTDEDDDDERFEVDDEDTSSASESDSDDSWETNTRTHRAAAAAVRKRTIPQKQKILPAPVTRTRYRPILPRPPPPGATEFVQTGQTLLVVNESGNPISSEEIGVLQPSSSASSTTPIVIPDQIIHHEGVMFQKLVDDCRYQCSICSSKCHFDRLQNHAITRHKNHMGLDLICEVCEKWFKGLESLEQHQKEVHQIEIQNKKKSTVIKQPRVKPIKKAGPDQLIYMTALLKKVGDGSYYHCSKCDKNVPARTMRKHVRTQHKIPPSTICKCEACEEEFPNQASLDAHISEVHQETEEEYNEVIVEKAKEAANRWMTRGHPEVSRFGVRLIKVGDGKQYQCSACDAIILVLKPSNLYLLRNHVVQHHTDLIKCGECGEGLPNQTSLAFHKKKFHTGQSGSTIKPKYYCPICQMPIKTNLHDLKTHMWTHFNKEEREEALYCLEKKPKQDEKPFKCDRCSMKFVKEAGLRRHFQQFHRPGTKQEELKKLDDSTFSFHDVILKKCINFEGEEIYKCSKCDDAVVAKTLRIAKRHVVGKHTRFFKCELCERRFPFECYLQKHMERKHLKTTPFPCHICGYPFYGKKAPRYHLWTHYSEEEKQEALARGEKVPSHFEKRYHCEKCGKSFMCNSVLQIHQRRAHEGEEVPKKMCQICGVEVKSLINHMRFQHPKSEEEYRFACTVCNRRYISYSRLRHHKKSCGVVDKNFKCEICGRDFKLKEQLHRNGVHLNIRPHQCSQCPMAFAIKEILRRHIQGKHEGKKFKQYPRRTPRNQLKKYMTKVTKVVKMVKEDTSGSSEEESDTDS